jgi:hypothetical protein
MTDYRKKPCIALARKPYGSIVRMQAICIIHA